MINRILKVVFLTAVLSQYPFGMQRFGHQALKKACQAASLAV